LDEALWHMLDEVKTLGGNGGAIAVSKDGEIAAVSSVQVLNVTTFASGN